MKKTLLSLLMAAAGAAAYAQPTLTAATNNPVGGDVFYGHYASTTGVNTSVTGAAITWDYSTLVQTSMDTTTYLACPAAPHCDSFAGSNIAAFDNTDYQYAIAGTSSFGFIGGYSGGEYTHLSDPLEAIFYPLTYHATHADTAHAAFSSSSGTVYITFADSFECDGYGTLILPSGTYTNAIRMRTTAIITDSVNIMGFPLTTASATETYTWYTAGFHSQLLSITYDTAGASAPYVSEVKYYSRPASAAVSSLPVSAGSMQLYPNPANNAVNVRFELTDNSGATLTITDLMGRIVTTISGDQLKKGTNDLSVPVSDLADGLYVARIQSASSVMSQKFTVRK